jgi:hypothetical protein
MRIPYESSRVAPDAIDDEEITASITVGSKGIYIKLE